MTDNRRVAKVMKKLILIQKIGDTELTTHLHGFRKQHSKQNISDNLKQNKKTFFDSKQQLIIKSKSKHLQAMNLKTT